MDPFRFVSRFVFIEQDREKFLEDLKCDKSLKLNILEKEVDNVTLMSQDEFQNLLTKYYIDTELYELAVKTPDVNNN